MPQTTAAKPVRMTADQRREQLLDVTRAIVGKDGFHSVSIERVAREAGVTRPLVYGHFGDLPGLLHALVDREGMRALVQLARILPAEPSEDDPRTTMLTALRGYLEAVQEDPVTWRLVLMPPEGAPPVLRERIAEGRAAAVAQLVRLAGPGLAPSGRAMSPDPELTAMSLSALADDWARLVLTEPAGYPIDRLVAHAEWLLEQLDPPRG
jgi:AcrR family transcriptional regulator